MAKKTNLPAGFASKTNFQTLSGVPTGQKLNATTEWNLGIQDLADSIDENYERLVLNWTNDIVADQVLAEGQYIDKDNVIYRVTTGYDVGAGKTFTAANFQVISQHDYKIWYIDGDNGSDSNSGIFALPVKTVQKGIDLREADGATTGEIKILAGIVSGTVTIASNPAKATLITGSLKGTALTTVNATDTTLRLVDITVSTLNITQTGANSMFTITYNSLVSQFNDTVATVGNSTYWAFQGSRLLISVAGSENFDTIFNIEDGSFMDIGGGSDSTWNHINLINRGTLDLAVSTITIDIVTAEKSFINLGDPTTLIISTTFDHIGVVFTNYENIDASAATEDGTSGEFSKRQNLQNVTTEGSTTDKSMTIEKDFDGVVIFKVKNVNAGTGARPILELQNNIDSAFIYKPNSNYTEASLRNKFVFHSGDDWIWWDGSVIKMSLNATTGILNISGNLLVDGQASTNEDTIKTFTATPEFDFDEGNDHQMTLTGNVTAFTTTNELGSANYKVYLINDATPGRTVAAPTGWTADTTSETHTTAADAINLYQFYTLPDGTKYFNLHIVKA